MFGKMMNNYYYGKSGKGDYTKNDLPKNRKQLFFEMLRIRLSALCRLNMMTILIFLPLIILLTVSLTTYLQGVNQYLIMQDALSAAGIQLNGSPISEETMAEINEIFAAGEYSEEAVKWFLNFSISDFNKGILWQLVLFAIPCILITGPVETGLAYITRNWARDEHAFIWSDFKDAVKENWKQGLGVSAITSVVPITIYVCWNFYGGMADTNGFFFIIPQILVLMLGLLWSLGVMYMYPMIVTYKLRFTQLIRNGLMLGMGRLPQTAGVRLLALVPSIILFLLLLFTSIGMYAIIVWVLYYVIIGVALSRFVNASLTNAVFDKFINPRIDGAKVNMGLNTEPDEDDEEEETEQKQE